jgi:SurA N-terminal domain
MFEYVRKHNRVMQLMLFILIFPAFALVGIDGYSRFNEKGTPVAVVDGQTIRHAGALGARACDERCCCQAAPVHQRPTLGT